MEKERKPIGYWTKEHVFEESHKYTTRLEFSKQSYGAYKVARKNGWLDEMDWLEKLKAKNGYWSKGRVFEEGRKYRTKSEFQKGCGAAYNAARKNKWLDEMTWFERTKTPFNDPMYIVYRYHFKEFNTLYIGLTMRMQERDNHHHKTGPVFDFAKSNNIKVPDMEVLVDGIYQKDALEYEDKLVKICRYLGFNVLNKAKTGVGSGSIGSGIRKWTKPRVITEAKKYCTKSEFQKGCGSAYQVAVRNGWIYEMCWFEEPRLPNGYWNKERVFEEGRKYSTKKEFENKCVSAYNVALKKKWIKEMDWFDEIIKPHGYWHDKERVFNEASKYRSRTEFAKGCSRAYDYARINGWLDILFPKAA